VEHASGQSYAEYVAEHIFEPLEMRHTHASRESALADGLSEGFHYMLRRAFVAHREGAFDVASGGLISSVEDLSHFTIANLNDGRYGDTSILSAQGILEMHTPPVLSNEGVEHYAMGWDVGEMDGTPFVAHSGLLYNFRAAIMMLPSSHRGVVLLANAAGFEQLLDLDQVTRGVASILEGKTPAPLVVPWQLPFLYWSVMLVPFLQVFGIAYSWRRWRGKGLVRVLLTVVLYGGIAYAWLTFVPQVMATPLFPGLREAYPDLFYPLMTGVVLGIGWSVIYAVLILGRRRA
jgi:CubicO group peptidase (beta-lactamase class C family)